MNATNRTLLTVLLFAVAQSLSAAPVSLVPSNADSSDGLGMAVSISGNTAAVGAVNEDGPNNTMQNAGVVYVWVHNGSAWVEQAQLRPSNLAAGDRFGRAVAISGDTLVAGTLNKDGATGAAYVFVRNGNSWTQQAFLRGSTTLLGDYFGAAVAIDGDTIVVGAPLEDGGSTAGTSNSVAYASGAAYVFKRSGTNWSEEAYLKAHGGVALPIPSSQFGSSVSISGDSVIVGAPYEKSSTTGINNPPIPSSSSFGAAFVYARSDATWTQQAYLKANTFETNSSFGCSVAINGDTAVVGAKSKGFVYTFERTGGTWAQQNRMAKYNIEYGLTVTLSEDKLLVGGVSSARFYARSNSVWAEQAYLADNYQASSGLGIATGFSEDRVIIGSWQGYLAYIYDLGSGSVPSPIVPAPGFNQLSGQLLGNGMHQLTFSGIPDANYALESTTSLISPQWTSQTTKRASQNGSLVFTTESTEPQIFYRVRQLP